VLRDFKSYTAKFLIAQLAAEGREWLLHQLRHLRAAHKPNEYQVWQEGSHPQAMLSDEIMRQKLEYLHHNPVKRGFVSSPEPWRYSSGAAPGNQAPAWSERILERLIQIPFERAIVAKGDHCQPIGREISAVSEQKFQKPLIPVSGER